MSDYSFILAYWEIHHDFPIHVRKHLDRFIPFCMVNNFVPKGSDLPDSLERFIRRVLA